MLILSARVWVLRQSAAERRLFDESHAVVRIEVDQLNKVRSGAEQE